MAGAPQPPPGWYRDPNGRPAQRYWDGAGWVGPEHPIQPAPRPPTRRPGPLWRRWWVITPAVLIGAIVVVGLVGIDAPDVGDAGPPAASDPADYDELGERDFALLVRSPDDYRGEQIVVYGRVTQFDAATGRAAFRGDTAASREELDGFFLGENTFMHGDEDTLADVVQDDLFRAYVTVMGSRTYRTGMGGRMTVPEFRVDLIEVLEPVD